MNIITVILILLVISLLVIIHEFGHFIASRKSGVRVEEFGLGYPPRIYGKKFGETVYSINLIPFGGFVRITGEGAETEEEERELLKDPESFVSKTWWQKSLILSAGIFMNLILSFFLFYLFFFINGFKTFYMPMIFDYKFKFGQENFFNTVVFDTKEGSPAYQAGIQPGNVILKVDGQDISDVNDLRSSLSGKAGENVEVIVLDIQDRTYSNYKTYTMIPELNVSQDSESGEGDSVLGVYLGQAVSLSYESTLEKILSGPLHTYNMLSYSVSALGKIIGFSVATRDIEPVSSSMTGPVGIFNVIGSIFKDGGGKTFLVLIDTVAIISLGFAFTNILPIPALDGGRIAFKIFEGVTKRKVSPKFEANVHRLGMIALLFFVVLITIKDLRI